MNSDYTIRSAVIEDVDTLVAFTLQEAREAEGLEVNVDAVRRGVLGAFEDPPFATYWVVETSGRIVASASVVQEWSNFFGGHYWWIQSFFILPEHRSRGLVEMLMTHIARQAKAAGALELRLYAHSSNERALRAYRRCGFQMSPYVILSRDRSP